MKFVRRLGRKGQGRGRDDRGVVMLIALLLMTGLIFVAGTTAIRSTRQSQVTAVELDNVRTFYASEGAVEWGAGQLKSMLDNVLDPTTGDLNTITAPTMPGFTISNFQVQKVGTLTQELITSGDYTGLNGYVQRYVISARANSQRRSAQISREIQHQFIPLFQFGVFYEKDLEIIPGAAMTFVGPIHTNGNLYMAADGSIQCNSTVTAVGKYWHFRKDGAHPDPPGPVSVKDKFGVQQNVWRGSYWLDNRRADWASQSLSIWGGNFRDAAQGISSLKLPLPPASDQHIVIEMGVAGDGPMEKDAKYWYKASVRYVNGTLTDSAGHVLPSQPTVYSLTQNKFTDKRENKQMDVVQIDVAAMIAGNYVPPNRILYVSYSGSYDAYCVRIVNAATLPTGGLTIATDLPLYVKGNYNSTAKKGSLLLSDAITLLSPNWNDANSNSSLSSRVPTAMTVNACVMTGHVPTDSGGTYSGGLENIFRFLENWNGTVSVTFSGSIIDLWYSRKATTPWLYGDPRYTAPQRYWSYDTDLLQPANWPPGTPRVHTVQRGVWRQIS
jgi:hypothetical protein